MVRGVFVPLDLRPLAEVEQERPDVVTDQERLGLTNLDLRHDLGGRSPSVRSRGANRVGEGEERLVVDRDNPGLGGTSAQLLERVCLSVVDGLLV